MKAKLIIQMPKPPKLIRNGDSPFWDAGKVIEHPRAYRLVQQGVAVPADKECELKASMSDDRMIAAAAAYDKVSKGIASEDYEAYDAGLMTGYKPDGKRGDTWQHGPNWVPGCEDEYYSDDEDEDDDE